MSLSELGLREVEKIEIQQFDHHSCDGVFIKRINIPKSTMVPQHAHSHAHSTLVGRGAILAWREKQLLGKFMAGTIIEIPANKMHEFMAVEDSEIYCIHNEEHALVTAENRIEP